jgi:hypothetical protein
LRAGQAFAVAAARASILFCILCAGKAGLFYRAAMLICQLGHPARGLQSCRARRVTRVAALLRLR